MAGLEEFVGLGVTIALTDLFSEGAEKISEQFEELAEKAGHGKHAVEDAIGGIKIGLASIAAGGALLAPFVAIGEKSIEVADQMERMEAAYGGLAEGGAEAFEQVQQVAEELGAFKTTEVAAAGQRLLEMGTNAEKVADLLRAAGDAALVMHKDIGQVADGLARLPAILQNPNGDPSRLLRQYGIGVGDLMAEGLKATKGKIQGTSEEIMDAVVSAMEKRFGTASGAIMAGLTGQEASFTRHIEDFYLHAGNGGFLALKTRILTGFNEILTQLGTGSFGESIGKGALMFYNSVAPIGLALKALAMGAAEFINEHPALVSAFVSVAGIAGTALVVVGALITMVSVAKVAAIAFEFLGEEALGLGEKLTAMFGISLPGLLGLAALAAIVYAAWESNFGGMRDTVTRWYHSISDLVEGVVALFTSTDDGVGTIPAELHDKLVDNGLWPVAKAIFLWGERVIEIGRGVMSGIGDTFSVVGSILSAFGSVITFVIDLVGELIGVVLDASHALGFLNDTSQTSLTVSKVLGEIVGVVAGIFLTYQAVVTAAMLAQKAWAIVTGIATFATEGYTAALAVLNSGIIGTTILEYGVLAALYAHEAAVWLVTAATTAWTAVQWAFNASMLANPLFWLVGVIALVVAGIATAIAYIDELREAFENMLDIKPMRWLMKAVGIIPEGANDADIDEGMASRDAEVNRRSARRGELGKDGFFDRIGDNLSGTDYASDQDYAEAQAADVAPGNKPYLTGGTPTPSLSKDEMTEAVRAGVANQPIQVMLDGEVVYQGVVSRERAAAERRGDHG